MGGNSNKRCCARWYSAASSWSAATLLLFMVPLIVISGFVSVLGPNTALSGWSSISMYRSPWLRSSSGASPSSSSNFSNQVVGVVPPPSKEGVVDLRSTVVVQVDSNAEEAISDEFSVPNRSSSSLLPKQDFPEIQLLVSVILHDSFPQYCSCMLDSLLIPFGHFFNP